MNTYLDNQLGRQKLVALSMNWLESEAKADDPSTLHMYCTVNTSVNDEG